MQREPNTDREPDIVLVILQRVAQAAPGIPADVVAAVERQVREEFGGQRVRIPKRKKHMSPEQRGEVFRAALTDAPTEQIIQAAGISRRTLYRLLKRGGT